MARISSRSFSVVVVCVCVWGGGVVGLMTEARQGEHLGALLHGQDIK